MSEQGKPVAPAGWKFPPIDGVCQRVPKIKPKTELDEPFRYIDVSSIDNEISQVVEPKEIAPNEAPSRARQLLHAGDVLLSTVRVYLRNIAQVGADKLTQIGSTAFCVLRAENGIEPRYLFHFVRSGKFIEDLIGLQRGNSPPAVLEDDVRDQSIPIPPTNEQKRIADKLDQLFSQLDEGEACLKRTRAQVARYRQSALKAAVTGELTRDWREKNAGNGETGEDLLKRILTARRDAWEAAELDKLRAKGQEPKTDKWKAKYKEPEPPDTSELPKLPERWVWVSIGQVSVSGADNGLYLPQTKYGSGTPIVRIDDYQDFYSRPRDGLQKVSASEQEIEKFCLSVGDLVVNRVNSISHLGKSLIVGEALKGCLFESNMMRVPLTSHVNSRFIDLYLKAAPGRNRLIMNAKHAVNQASINQGDVLGTVVPLPPSSEQAEIVKRLEAELSNVDKTEDQFGQLESHGAALRQSILKAAFSGQLVPQDPSEEPASVLLERIAAEREEQPKTTKRKTSSRRKDAAAQMEML